MARDEEQKEYRMVGPYVDATQFPVEPPERDLSRLRDGDLFTDYDGDELGDRLVEMWQIGVLNARWNEDEQATEYGLSEFGIFLHEADLYRVWHKQQHVDVDLNETPAAVEVLR